MKRLTLLATAILMLAGVSAAEASPRNGYNQGYHGGYHGNHVFNKFPVRKYISPGRYVVVYTPVSYVAYKPVHRHYHKRHHRHGWH